VPNPSIDDSTKAEAIKLYRTGMKIKKIGERLGIAQGTMFAWVTDDDKAARAEAVAKKARDEADPHVQPKKAKVKTAALPASDAEAEDDGFPEAIHQVYEPYVIDRPGKWGVISDIHLPHHDRTTVELFVAEAKRRGCIGIILDGDTLDSHEISDHDKDPTAPRYVREIEVCRELLAWLRKQFPKGEIVYKDGNHEERLERYIIRKAPAFFGMACLSIPELLQFDEFGIEYVGDQRVITLGNLNVLHGHEYRGGVSSPVNPARGLYLKARSVAMAGHHHQTSEHHAKDVRQRAEAAWSLGCACFLNPRYLRQNNWNNGFAFVETDSRGEFVVENKRVLGGKIV
jgi:predicted phosphodiesterase